MSKDDSTVKMARPGEPEAVRTTIVGGRPPGGGAIPRDIPRGLEVLIKKAAVDPAFKDILFDKRAGAAEAIGLKLTAAEEAMLNAVPEAQLRAIVANTKVSPGLRPAFLGATAGVMLAALSGVGCKNRAPESTPYPPPSTGINPDIPETGETAGATEEDVVGNYGWISGLVTDQHGKGLSGALVVVENSKWNAIADTDGYYQIRVVPAPEGFYTLTASYAGYEPETKTDVKVIPGARTNVSFMLLSPGSKYDYVPSTQPLIKGIMPDRPSKKGE